MPFRNDSLCPGGVTVSMQSASAKGARRCTQLAKSIYSAFKSKSEAQNSPNLFPECELACEAVRRGYRYVCIVAVALGLAPKSRTAVDLRQLGGIRRDASILYWPMTCGDVPETCM